jgi:hypothetical protein
MNPHAPWPGNATTTTPEENPMADSKPITRRELTEAQRHERGETKRFLAVSIAPLRARIERIERRLYITPEPGYLDSYAADQAAAFDQEEDEK